MLTQPVFDPVGQTEGPVLDESRPADALSRRDRPDVSPPRLMHAVLSEDDSRRGHSAVRERVSLIGMARRSVGLRSPVDGLLRSDIGPVLARARRYWLERIACGMVVDVPGSCAVLTSVVLDRRVPGSGR